MTLEIQCRVCGKTLPPGDSTRWRTWCTLDCRQRHTCRGCRTRLRDPSLTGHCGFCEVELWGYPPPDGVLTQPKGET